MPFKYVSTMLGIFPTSSTYNLTTFFYGSYMTIYTLYVMCIYHFIKRTGRLERAGHRSFNPNSIFHLVNYLGNLIHQIVFQIGSHIFGLKEVHPDAVFKSEFHNTH